MVNHWFVMIDQVEGGETSAILYERSGDADLTELGRWSFGPFDTAYDVLQAMLRVWAPRAHFALR